MAAPFDQRSCAIPERLGFAREGVAREAEPGGGGHVDQVVYSMRASDRLAREC